MDLFRSARLLGAGCVFAACGPAVSGDEEGGSQGASSSGGSDAGVDATTTVDTGGTGVEPPEFDDGEDDCLGPDGVGEAQSCLALASASLADVTLEYEGGDGVWNAGETLKVRLNYVAGEHDIDAPAMVAQVDIPNRQYVSVTWIWWNAFVVFATEQVEYEILFVADPQTPAGTEVALRLGAASSHGSLTQCDCPESDIDAWTDWLTIE